MTRLSDQTYLLKEQYADAGNLSARIQLHARFTTNTYGWQRWVFDHFDFEPKCRILELGCGPGALWKENFHRLPAGWNITLSDFSQGMLAETQQALEDMPHDFTFEVIDAQSIPFPDSSFDGVIANHMLYHVPDMDKALAEIARILKPSGRFYATTIGSGHLKELHTIITRFFLDRLNPPASFLLDNGKSVLARYFDDVQIDRYEDALIVTNPQMLFEYICSMSSIGDVTEEALSNLKEFLHTEIHTHGKIYITKDSGILTARVCP